MSSFATAFIHCTGPAQREGLIRTKVNKQVKKEIKVWFVNANGSGTDLE